MEGEYFHSTTSVFSEALVHFLAGSYAEGAFLGNIVNTGCSCLTAVERPRVHVMFPSEKGLRRLPPLVDDERGPEEGNW